MDLRLAPVRAHAMGNLAGCLGGFMAGFNAGGWCHGLAEQVNIYLAVRGGQGTPPLPVQVHAIRRSFV